MAFVARKKNEYYFEMFLKGTQLACKAAQLLEKDFSTYTPQELPARIVDMHEVEHSGDMARHEMLSRLTKEFITPIDREDIMDLGDIIDDVTDSIDDILMRAYMFNIKELRPEALEFSHLIAQCTQAMNAMMEEFPHFRKSSTIHEKIVEINRLEEAGDRLYTAATHRLYSETASPVEIIAWTALFERMEKCADACEHVADVVERVIMKNT